MKIKKEVNAGEKLWAKRSTEHKTFTFDITGDKVVDVEEIKPPNKAAKGHS